MPLGLKKSQESPLPKPPTVPKVTRQTIWVRKMQLFVGKSAFRLRNAVCPACKPANQTRNSPLQLGGRQIRTEMPSSKLEQPFSTPQCSLSGVQTCKSGTKFASANCGKAFPNEKTSPQVAERQIRTEKGRRNLREAFSGQRCRPAACGDLFRPCNADSPSNIPPFAQSTPNPLFSL